MITAGPKLRKLALNSSQVMLLRVKAGREAMYLALLTAGTGTGKTSRKAAIEVEERVIATIEALAS